ncbi:MAG: biopolymer transporter ExbD [Bacteroidales bacterium]|nr:biopolymer transporter ExbD [Bacteroidales bacterium]
MAIKSHNKISAEFSMASMSNLVFLLLIFFILTSTLVAPNAIKLLLPSGSGKTISKQSTFVSINNQNQFFVNETPATDQNLQQLLTQSLIGQTEGVIVLQLDRTAPVQSFVTVIEAVNQMNKVLKTKHKVILATTPK